MIARHLAILMTAAAILPIGCDRSEPQPPLISPRESGTPKAAPQAPAAPAAAPVASAPAASESGPLVSAMGVSVTLPDGWNRKPRSNQMRLAEAEVPGAGGDVSKACIVVFSTAGGSVDDNIERWSGQVRDGSGNPTPAVRETLTVGGLPVTVVSMTGSYAGMGDGTPKSDWMLRGAIVEAPEGLLFIKMTGPAGAMGAAQPAFKAMVDSIKKP